MLDTQEFGDFLQSVGLRDFVGVPCSYLAPLINYAINQNCFIMSNNEGDAVAIASGISLARSNLAFTQSLNEYDSKADSLTCRLISNSLTCHSEAIAEESKNTMPDEMFRSAQHDKDTESNRHCERSEAIHKGCRTSNSADSREIRCETNLIRYGVVLMQNSGLSNALSPLTSLNHTFEIPILGFVSLRGERDGHGKNTDEPQHELLGIITDKLLQTCNIAYAFLDSNMESAKAQVQEALSILQENKSFFFIVRDKTFCKVKLENNPLQDTESSLSLRGSVAIHNTTNPHLQIHATHLDSKEWIATSALRSRNDEISESSKADATTHGNSKILSDNISNNAAGFLGDFCKCGFRLRLHKGCQGGGEGSLLNINDQADNADSLKSGKKPTHTLPTRLEALRVLHNLALKSQALLLATTGKCGRELYEIADTPNQLYMVGSMGCVSSLALGISLKTSQKVIAIDGDSALLMRLGALSTNAYYANTHKRGNFCHILLDNESHDSTGGQFNLSPFVDFSAIAKACGYANVYVAQNLEEFEEYLTIFLDSENGHSALSESCGSSEKSLRSFMSNKLPCDFSHNPQASSQALECQVPLSSKSLDSQISESSTKGATFIYLKIAKGSKSDLGRPKITPKEVARRLEGYIKSYAEARMQDSLHSSESRSKAHIYTAQNTNTRGE